jgi:hypothetical protein
MVIHRPEPLFPGWRLWPAWSAFCLLDSDDEGFITGTGANGLFCARFGRRVEGLSNRLADLLRYERAHGRTVIVPLPADVDAAGYVAHALRCTPAARIVRRADSPVVVHSTTLEAWESIRADGELRARSLLPAGPSSPGQGEPSEIERYLLDEPPEYGDYVMLGEIDSVGPEAVVASYQAGRFILGDQAIYKPGVRLYFDNHRIIQHGLGTRDGLHTTKVLKRLPLRSYLLAAVTVVDIAPGDRVAEWTLRTFVDCANKAFRDRL